jgi:hypothetical protein
MHFVRFVFLLLLAPAAWAADPAPAPAKAPVTGVCGDQSKVPADKRLGNTVKWSTASEEDTFGYDVYRGEKEDGPFVRLTKTPILGAGTSNDTHKYQYVDDSADPCADHWYYVEEITTQGTRDKFTPVFKRPAKLLKDGTPAPPKPAVAAEKK